MIDPKLIADDEIGQIMKSRNETVAQLRRQEDHLASALRQLEEQDRLSQPGTVVNQCCARIEHAAGRFARFNREAA